MDKRWVKIFLGLGLVFFYSQKLWATVYPIRSATELAALDLRAGDTVKLANGPWIDQHLVLQGQGTQEKPIVLQATHAGKVMLRGSSNLRIDGSWLVVEGLNFHEGYTVKGDVVTFAPTASHCRLTNSAIYNYNPPDDATDYKWVSMYGEHNRVDHCFLTGKNHQGPTLVVWLSEKPNYHRIDHNYFGPRPPLGRNGGETIRIGTSTWSLFDSYTLVENNVFDRCDGELEIISNKSGHNTFRNNVFYESKGTLTLRHGNNATVVGNYFLGNGIGHTGGIRIIGENHRVFNNYFHGLTGTGVSAAVSIMDGVPNSPLVGYYQVKQAQVVANTIVHCREAFSIGTGKNEQRDLPPQDSHLANNLVYDSETLFSWIDTPQNLTVAGNIAFGMKDREDLPAGVKVTDPKVKRDPFGIYRPARRSPVRRAFKGEYTFVETDLDRQPRQRKKDVGADQYHRHQPPIIKDPDIGPEWVILKREISIREVDQPTSTRNSSL